MCLVLFSPFVSVLPMFVIKENFLPYSFDSFLFLLQPDREETGGSLRLGESRRSLNSIKSGALEH